jgi:hypothetical protein
MSIASAVHRFIGIEWRCTRAWPTPRVCSTPTSSLSSCLLRSAPLPLPIREWSGAGGLLQCPTLLQFVFFQTGALSKLTDSDEPFRLSFFVFVLVNLEHAVLNPDLKQASKFGPVLFLAWVQPEHLGNRATDPMPSS